MSYREENGQVVLTMSREDYASVLLMLGIASGYYLREYSGNPKKTREAHEKALALLNRLNEGNSNYTPYQVTEKS